jgi:hypothetical protein
MLLPRGHCLDDALGNAHVQEFVSRIRSQIQAHTRSRTDDAYDFALAYAGYHHAPDSLIYKGALRLLPEGEASEKERNDHRGFHRTTFRLRTGAL